MEKIAIGVVVNPQTADRIQKEVIRQSFVDDLTDLLNRMFEAGFRLEITAYPNPEQTMFSNKIQIPPTYFVCRSANK
jgi:hypothetical protein